MYDKTLLLDRFQHVDDILHTLIESTIDISSLDTLLKTADGMLRLRRT